MSVIELNKDNFATTVENSGIVFIDFWAEWCGPCRAFAPVFAKAADTHPNIVFGKVDTEDQPELGAAFNVRSIPTLICFRDQIVVFQQAGALPPAALAELIGKVEALDMDDVRKRIAEHEAEHEAGHGPN